MDDRDTIHTPEVTTDEMEASLVNPRVEVNLMKWAKVAGAVMGLFSVLGSAWTAIGTVNDLHDTILANKIAVGRMVTENNEQHAKLSDDISGVADAIRTARSRDQEVIVNLRIAVAALQASRAARDGRAGYSGIQDLPGFGTGPTMPPPSSRSDRISQSERANQAAEGALRRAASAQRVADESDPLAGLEGL